MSLEQTACDAVLTDLKAFERRLTEVIACLQPATTRWRSDCIGNCVVVYSYSCLALADRSTHSCCITDTVSMESSVLCCNINIISVIIHDGSPQEGYSAEHHNCQNSVSSQ
ncbi:unnamed protein product [Leptidea sinapis]|uniref:Transmembrane protein 188 n=1 Tax=Leptidea sinapis TaxID=189913 RepID=A0A5E4R218_9NEOP|nr:unnamed protein product [Leptidea sinapis]